MRTRRIGRTAKRGVVALVLAWLGVMVGWLLLAPSASAAPTATVYIRDLTPPLVSVDQNGTVTFVNQIQDKTVQVGGGGLVPTLVDATVHTDVTLVVPSGSHTLQSQPDTDPNPEPNSSWKEQFKQSCVTCTITYTYRVTVGSSSIVGAALNSVTSQAIAAMPQNQVVTYNGKQTTVTIGVPTPFIVNTLLPLPNLPSVNLPSQIIVTVPNPGNVQLPSAGGVTGGATTGTVTTTTTTTTTTPGQGINGDQYTYLAGLGAPSMAPAGSAGAAFDSLRFAQSSSNSSSSSGATGAGGSGGQPGSYDGASVPVYGLDGTKLDDASASSTLPADGGSRPLSVPALVAVVTLAGVLAALVRTQQVRRAAKR